jgi:nitrogen regulatory protein PII-like uncharacterized protein
MRIVTRFGATMGFVAGLGLWRWKAGRWPWNAGRSPRERVESAITEVMDQSDDAVFVGGAEKPRSAA